MKKYEIEFVELSSCSEVNKDTDFGLFISHFRHAKTMIHDFFTCYHYLMTWRYLKDTFQLEHQFLLTFLGNYLKFSNVVRTNSNSQWTSTVAFDNTVIKLIPCFKWIMFFRKRRELHVSRVYWNLSQFALIYNKFCEINIQLSSFCSEVNTDTDFGLFISHIRRANTVINDFFTRYHYLMTWQHLKDIFPISK